MAAAVAFVTGHEDPGQARDADRLARARALPGHVGVLHGGARAAADRRAARRRRASPGEPVAIVERGTLPDQRAVHGTLADIVARAAGRGGQAAVGDGRRAGRGAGRGAGLAGPRAAGAVSVVVTRPKAQASGLAGAAARPRRARRRGAGDRARAAGLRACPTSTASTSLVLSSPNGAERFFAALRAAGRDARALAGARVAVIGPGTADAVRAHGIEPDLVPRKAVGESLAELVAGLDVRHALVVRARGGRDVVRQALAGLPAARGSSVARALRHGGRAAGRAHAARGRWRPTGRRSPRPRRRASSSRRRAAPSGPRDSGLRLASIGPITTEALRELGLEPDDRGRRAHARRPRRGARGGDGRDAGTAEPPAPRALSWRPAARPRSGCRASPRARLGVLAVGVGLGHAQRRAPRAGRRASRSGRRRAAGLVVGHPVVATRRAARR